MLRAIWSRRGGGFLASISTDNAGIYYCLCFRRTPFVCELCLLIYFSQDLSGNTASIKDLAKAGKYAFSIDDFAPFKKCDTCDELFPEMKLKIYDATKPDKPITIKIKSTTVKKIWEDFLPYTNHNQL